MPMSSLIRMLMPLERRADRQPQLALDPSTETPLMARILLVDDDPANLGVAGRVLTEQGHTITTATDGSEALDQFTAAPEAFDLVVADVQMPGLDGIALVEQMLAMRTGLKAILMSGLQGELTRAEQLKARGVHLLSKPYTLEALKGAVSALV
jgi:CheY-like chemotaxis protein